MAVSSAIAALRAPLESKRSFATVGRNCGTVDMISLLIAPCTPSVRERARRRQCIRAFGSVSTPHCSVRKTQTSTETTAPRKPRDISSVVELHVCLEPVVVVLVTRVPGTVVQEIAEAEHEAIAEAVVELDDVTGAVSATTRPVRVRERADDGIGLEVLIRVADAPGARARDLAQGRAECKARVEVIGLGVERVIREQCERPLACLQVELAEQLRNVEVVEVVARRVDAVARRV